MITNSSFARFAAATVLFGAIASPASLLATSHVFASRCPMPSTGDDHGSGATRTTVDLRDARWNPDYRKPAPDEGDAR